MVIVQQGLGFLVIVFIVVVGFFFYEHDPKAFMASNGPFGWTVIISGILCGIVGFLLRRRRPRVLLDMQTGKKIEVWPTHSFFFIPLMFWCPLLIAWGIFLMVRDAMSPGGVGG
jgi:hypothetical protein